MTTYQVSILNLKAIKFLQDLADLNLISISPTTEDNFPGVLNKLFTKSTGNSPPLGRHYKRSRISTLKSYTKK